MISTLIPILCAKSKTWKLQFITQISFFSSSPYYRVTDGQEDADRALKSGAGSWGVRSQENSATAVRVNSPLFSFKA